MAATHDTDPANRPAQGGSFDTELVKMALVLGLMALIGPFAIDMYLPALPTIAADLATDPSVVQLTLTVYFLAFGVSQIVYGPISDMVGRKPPIYFGLGLFAVTSIGCAMAPTIEALVALRFLQGLGAAAVMSIPRAIIRDRYTGPRATRLMSTVMLVISVSPMLAPLAGSFVIDAFGWRTVFLAVTVGTGLSLLLNLFVLPETLAPGNRVPVDFGGMFRAFGTLLKDLNFMGLKLIGGAGMGAFFTFLGSASFVYMDHFGLSPRDFAIAFAANAAGFFLATQFSATILARLGAARLMQAASVSYAAVVIVLFALFAVGLGSLPLMIGLLVFSNLFMGLIIPSAMVMSLEEHGAIAGAAASLGGTLQMVTASVAMVIGGLMFDGTPLPMLGIIAVCGAIAAVLALVTVRTTSSTA